MAYTERNSEVPKLSTSAQQGKLGQTLKEPKYKVLTWPGNNMVWDTILVTCTQDYRLEFDEVICQHLKLSLGVFPKQMVSHSLSLKGLLGMFTSAVAFLGSHSPCLMKFLLVNSWSRNLFSFTDYQSQIGQPPKLKADYITLFISSCLLSLLLLPRGFPCNTKRYFESQKSTHGKEPLGLTKGNY